MMDSPILKPIPDKFTCGCSDCGVMLEVDKDNDEMNPKILWVFSGNSLFVLCENCEVGFHMRKHELEQFVLAYVVNELKLRVVEFDE